MTPLEAERILQEESEASAADSLERRFSAAKCGLVEQYRGLVRLYGGPDGGLIPQSLVFKLADSGIRSLVRGVLSDFLGWCCFTSACAAFKERGEVNARFVQAFAEAVSYGLSGREPATPRDEDFHKLNPWRFGGFAKYTRFPYLFPAMQNSAVWLLGEEILWLLENRAPNPLAVPWMTAQISKLGFDADQVFRSTVLGRAGDSEARTRFFAQVDRFADQMPFPK